MKMTPGMYSLKNVNKLCMKSSRFTALLSQMQCVKDITLKKLWVNKENTIFRQFLDSNFSA